MIEEKLIEISSLLKLCKIKDIGLLTGLSGVNIFLSTIKPINFEKNIENNLCSIISSINNGFNGYSYCSGIGGFIWSLNFLLNTKNLDKHVHDIGGKFASFLYARMKYDLERNQWDFLHGAIGIGISFLYHNPNKQNISFINELIDSLDYLCVQDITGGVKWKSKVLSNAVTMEVYNLSLAHGIASIIAFATKTYAKGINKQKSKIILEGAIQFLLKNQNDINKYNCYFPSWIRGVEVDKFSRLGWCYGDLGIGVVLYNAAKALTDISLKEFALTVLRRSTFRRNLDEEFVLDAGICHGTSGIAHIFYRMYWNTKDEIFKDAASFWFERTIEMSNHADGLAGFKAFHSDEDGGFQNEYGILEGIAGIGLTFHSWITQTEPTWDECLLLS